MYRKRWIALTTSAVFSAVLAGCGSTPATSSSQPSVSKTKTLPKVVISEPVHSLSYLPLYVAIHKGLFKGVDVSFITQSANGSDFVNAVLSGQAFAFIGGPEHDAFANVKGGTLRTVVDVVNRGNVYLVARPGLKPGTNLKTFLKGKRIAAGPYGGTPDDIMRYILHQDGLTVGKDVTLLETQNSAIPALMKQGKADIAVVSDPMLSEGIQQGLWQQPFYDVPKALGPYAYSTLNLPLATIQKDPKTVQTIVNGLLEGLKFVEQHHNQSLALATAEFPDVSPSVVKSAMDRSYADHLWGSGAITQQSLGTDLAVVRQAGLLHGSIGYQQIVAPQFVPSQQSQ